MNAWTQIPLLSLLLVPLLGHAQLPDDSSDKIFASSDQCMACHNGLQSSSGEDVSIGLDWAASMMANSARDPYWQAAVRREMLEHPEAGALIEDECAACHMPMTRYEAKVSGGKGRIFAHLPFHPDADEASRRAEDGVSCTVCHQISERDLGSEESFTGNFHIEVAPDGQERGIVGPYDIDQGRQQIMHSASGFVPRQGRHLQASELCASCHTLYTHALGQNGQVIGELPEQVPYLEWQHSAYADEQSCQDCHMPVVQEATRIASVLGEEREGLNRHSFRGANFFMQRLLSRYRDELSVEASADSLALAAQQTVEHLQSESAELSLQAELQNGELLARVQVENFGGHKLPTAYPSRRVWVELELRDAAGVGLFASGALRPDGSIQGNDNDRDAGEFEPHYERIDDPEQVLIYEAIMSDDQGRPTTGLLNAVDYLKDNRLLPRGFDKSSADADIAVHGDALNDGNFAGGRDQVEYRISTGQASGPLQVRARLWYQPIAFRWAHNLGDFEAAETRRFLRMYTSMAGESAVILDQTEVTLAGPGSR